MRRSRPRMLITASIILAVVVACLAVAVVIQRIEAARLSSEVMEQRGRLGAASRKLRGNVKCQKDYEALSLKLGGRLRSCTWSDQLPYMLGQLDAIIQSQEIKMDSLQPEPMTVETILRFPMRLSFQTDISRLTKVLAEIDRATPLLKIERLHILNSKESKENLQVDMTVASFVVLDKDAPVQKRRAIAKTSKNARKVEPPDQAGDSSTKKLSEPRALRLEKSVKPSLPAPTTKPTQGGPR